MNTLTDDMFDRIIGKVTFLMINTIFTLWALISFFNIKGLFAAIVGFGLLWKHLFKEESIEKNAGQFLYLFVFVDLSVLIINQFDVIRPFYSEDIAETVINIFINNFSLYIVGFALVFFTKSWSLGRVPAFLGVELINYVFAISIGGNGDPFNPEFQEIGWSFLILSTIISSIWYASLEISNRCGKKDGTLLYEILYFVGLALIFNANFGYIVNLLCEFSNIINYLTVCIYTFWKYAVIIFIVIVSMIFLCLMYAELLDKNTLIEIMVLYFICELYIVINYAIKHYFPYQWILIFLHIAYCMITIGKVYKENILIELKDNFLCWNNTILGYIIAPIVTIICINFVSKGYYLSIIVCLFYFLRFINRKDMLSFKGKKIWYELCVFITLLSISYIIYLGLSAEKIITAIIIMTVVIVTFKVLDTEILINYEEPKYIRVVLVLCVCLLSFMNVNKENKKIHTEYNGETKNLMLVTNLDEEELKNIEIMYYFSNRSMMAETEPKQYKKGEIKLQDEMITIDVKDQDNVTSRYVGFYPRELEKIKIKMSNTKYDSAMKKVQKNIAEYTKKITLNTEKKVKKNK